MSMASNGVAVTTNGDYHAMPGPFGDEASPPNAINLLSKMFLMEKNFNDELAKIRCGIEKILTEGERRGRQPNGAMWSFQTHNSAAASAAPWMPLTVRNMPPMKAASLEQSPLALEKMITFSKPFLVKFLGGKEWSPGFYYPANAAKSQQLKTILKSEAYYLLDAETNPFVPKEPTEHGAMLTVIFRVNDTAKGDELYEKVPLFVALEGQGPGEKKYTYLGTYSQTRWSDKLDVDRVREVVPRRVKEAWAYKLTDPQREEWIENVLAEQLWPMPSYSEDIFDMGPEDKVTEEIPATEAKSEQLPQDLLDYYGELMEWKRDAKTKVALLKAENILQAFEQADADSEPGLRFWWEYLECVSFDRNFYYLLASAKKALDEHDEGTN